MPLINSVKFERDSSSGKGELRDKDGLARETAIVILFDENGIDGLAPG